MRTSRGQTTGDTGGRPMTINEFFKRYERSRESWETLMFRVGIPL
jgi:hypothetical protein